jgi:uncharacterized membrane protein
VSKNKERRKSSPLNAYMFFAFEIVFILEVAYIYTTFFGTSVGVLIPLGLLVVFALSNSLKRFLKVLQRIKFSNTLQTHNPSKN